MIAAVHKIRSVPKNAPRLQNLPQRRSTARRFPKFPSLRIFYGPYPLASCSLLKNFTFLLFQRLHGDGASWAPLSTKPAAYTLLFVFNDGAGLAGILLHDTTGQSTTLRYWHVAGDRHGRGIGSRLMHAFLARCATSRRVTLWVIADNTAAIAKYHHYGFSEDGMIDDIMVRQVEVAR